VCLAAVADAEALFMDINSFLRFDGDRSLLQGAETSLSFNFRFCNDKGLLLYAEGSRDESNYDFFALGVNSGSIYLEWKTAKSLIEVLI
jgi:hypothetical protein